VSAARRAGVAAPGLALLLGGCVQVAGPVEGVPVCPRGDAAPGNAVVLLAQSVPTATWVPCLRESAVPRGWDVVAAEATRGGARLQLRSDRAGARAIEVALSGPCSTEGATEVPSDHPAMRRFERVSEVTPLFRGQRTYVFEGGCVTVTLEVEGADRVEPLAVATAALGMVSRGQLRQAVREDTGGRLTLDPDEEGRP
jgi:hypothetical protein